MAHSEHNYRSYEGRSQVKRNARRNDRHNSRAALRAGDFDSDALAGTTRRALLTFLVESDA